jgi:hypothetical protein
MDTNTVQLVRDVVKADPQQIMGQLAGWISLALFLAAALGRIVHAYKTGNSATGAVFAGTNAPPPPPVAPTSPAPAPLAK